jgi:retinol dehydrogenase 12
MSFFNDVYTQLFQKPPYPHNDFSGMIIIVTGANIGLGLEASKHFVRMGAAKVIVAVRSVSKGEAAKQEIERQTERAGTVDVWDLDYSSYASVKAFAARAAALQRLDAAVLNAGIATEQFELFEDNESTITVNVVSTTLLMLLLLPTLRASAQKHGVEPVLAVVGSGVHAYTSFPERNAPSCFDELNDPKKARMKDRYVLLFHSLPS